MNAPVLRLINSSITHLLHRASQHAEDLFARSVADAGLTARQFIVLAVVDGLDDPSQTALCEVSGIDRSTLADIVRRLVARGLLSRRRTRRDARMYAVRITPEGKRMLERAMPTARDVDAQLLQGLTTAQRQDFEVALKKIVAQGPLSKAA
jgi:DNA-binding MarR family transcriptional regulator